MIYWETITDFDSACKCIKYLTFNEFDNVIYKKRYDKECWRFKMLWEACKHYSDLRKLDKSYRGTYGKMPKVASAKFGDILWEYRVSDGKKICGYPLKGLPYGWICTRDAGFGSLHLGYGYCREHEMIETPEVRKDIWLKLRKLHTVPSLVEVLERAEQVEEIAVKSMSADLSYLEVARQSIMSKAEENSGSFSREMTSDLTMISETIAKVKALKVKTEQMNWIPPEQVGMLILQVLDAVTKSEDESVRRRIALRARELSDIVVPRIEDKNPEMPAYVRDRQVKQALAVAGKHNPNDWGAAVPGLEQIGKSVPNYKRKKFTKRDGAE